MKFKSLFVTGTDTGVGKTTVSCGIAAALHRKGSAVGVLKPVETGCSAGPDGRLLPQDAAQLQYFSGCRFDLEHICPMALEQPLAPLVAARHAGVCLEVDRLLEAHTTMAARHDVTIIEGAGGLLVPIARGVTFADLAARMNALVVVVVGSRLGAINHALLTIRYARSMGLAVLGYVVNFLTDDPDLAASTNVDVLAEWCGPPLGIFPYIGKMKMDDASRQQLADAAATHIRLDDLLVPC